MKFKTCILVGSCLGFFGIGFSAFAAHWLQTIEGVNVETFKTGAQYMLWHGIAFLGLGLWLKQDPENRLLKFAASSWIVGVVLFSGSLFALSLSGVRILGAITPFGGLAFLAGWFAMILAASKLRE